MNKIVTITLHIIALACLLLGVIYAYNISFVLGVLLEGGLWYYYLFRKKSKEKVDETEPDQS